MAENFEDVVKKLGSTVKKPSAAKASAVLAVQMVDSKGKVIKEEKGAAAAEAQREEEKRGKKTNTLLETIANAVTAPAGTGVSEKDKQKGGLLAGIGGALSGMGIGVGAATAGIGALFAGGGYLLKQIAEFDGKAVVANVKELLNITKLFSGIGDAFAKSGIMAVTMTAIAAGLIAFSVATMVASTAQAFTQFTDTTNWAQTIYDNVETLVGIQKIPGYDSFKSLEFLGVMAGIGAGLVAFAGGEATSSLAQALTKFLDTGGWAQTIKDNVKTLISIQDIPGYNSFEKAKFLLTMGGIGLGLVAFSIGEVAASMTKALTRFLDTSDWAQTIYDNVETLVGIQKIPGYNKFDKTNFLLTMGAIALGLVAFSIGEVATSMATAFTQFTDTGDWAKTIKDNVTTLVGIQNIVGYNTFDKAKFLLTMGGIGLGLVAFSIGEVAASTTKALTQFLDTGGWAQTIKDNVKTLIGIQNIPGYNTFDKTNFLLTMGGIGLGLLAFSIGQVATNMAEAFTQFTDTTNWAQTIYDNVKTLISITSIPDIGKDTAAFIAVMTGIGAGLLAFSFGKGVAGFAEAITRFSGVGTEGSFATKIKDEVTTLLSILSDENATIEKSNTFKTVMGNISAGLLTFSGNTFLSSLLEVGKSVLGFLTGDSSPIAEVMKLAEKSDELTKGADAISKIGDGLDKMGKLKFDGSDINLAAFAEDLMKSVPLIEKAIMGGTVEKGFLDKILPDLFGGGSDLIFKGLASGDINYEEAAKNIRMLRKALGTEVNIPPPTGTVSQDVGQAALRRLAAAGGAGGGITSINTGGNVVSAPTTNYVNNGIAARRPVVLGSNWGAGM